MKVDAYNELEDYIYDMKSKVEDVNIRRRLSQKDLKKIVDVVEKAIQWLDIHKLAETNEIADMNNELERVCNSILGKFI